MNFKVLHTDRNTQARSGYFFTGHGKVETPIFMPVGTLGSVKGVHARELKQDIGAEIILANTYHLYLRPGLDLLEQAGGVHKFMNWDQPLLTDSGGYQVYSLAANRKIQEEGVTFQSHIDGSRHFLSPESAIDIQRKIGADIIMAFDECTPYPCAYDYARKSLDLTHRWLDRCMKQMENTTSCYGHEQYLFPIVQGSTYPDLRRESAQRVAEKNAAGNAIGGLSVGEPAEEMYAMTEEVCQLLPLDKPRYLMGVGTPENIVESIASGIDMFDCVLPTRNARHGIIYTSQGVMNIKNEKWKDDLSPLDEGITGYASNHYSKAYVRHLITSKEMLGAQITTLHNLSFYMWLVRKAREEIEKGTFLAWKNKIVPQISTRR